mgnify:CR=1 FL=1
MKKEFRKFIDLHPCPYCNNKGKMIREFNEIQGLHLYKGTCSKKCDVRAMTFAVKHRECAVELWNAAYINVIRKTKGD